MLRDEGAVMIALHGIAIITLAAAVELTVLWIRNRSPRYTRRSLDRATPERANEIIEHVADSKRRGDLLRQIARHARSSEDVGAAIGLGRQKLREIDAPLNLLAWTLATGPLLGILGTASGIAAGFGGGGVARLPDPGAVASGISLALESTIWGLSVSIVAASFRAYFMRVRTATADGIHLLIGLIRQARA
ncbi:MAG: MotA/TolQ/ExbB proton channel family protein [Planctomycetota bacterium]